ncbi:MAG: hypothetical protein EA345_06200 [Halomonas sp.]|nr:MAG: hypothetical protein EA345_06200 [Halomonas sp.]
MGRLDIKKWEIVSHDMQAGPVGFKEKGGNKTQGAVMRPGSAIVWVWFLVLFWVSFLALFLIRLKE